MIEVHLQHVAEICKASAEAEQHVSLLWERLSTGIGGNSRDNTDTASRLDCLLLASDQMAIAGLHGPFQQGPFGEPDY